MRTYLGHIFVMRDNTPVEVAIRYAQSLLARDISSDTLYFCPSK